MKTPGGSTIREVFWYDADRKSVGVLAGDGNTTFASEWSLNEFRPCDHKDLRDAAQVVIEEGAVVASQT